ncbi:hypothetical protein CVT26_006038 [Gymnopilus dilepis]|uniref:Zinc finger PHD-type domain-containing protein n=1 Tax=Gymnopilus dilepis TaxID=231916 RepID=A0A409VQA2_9AGAR|nr:hypothetical protein CVT26_006038 [Gymnopilus dilepis]
MPRIDTIRVSTALTRARASPYPRSPSPPSGEEMEVQLAAGQGMQVSNSSNTFSFFQSAQDVRLEGVKLYNISGNYIHVDGKGGESEESTGIKGLRVADREDVVLDRQIYRGLNYRLHGGRNRSKGVVVKIYDKGKAKERYRAEAELYSKLYHPNIPNLIAISSLESPRPFLVFQGSYDGPLEHVLKKALKKGLKESWVMGVNTIAGLSSALSYLEDEGFKFASCSPDDIVLLSSGGKPVITFESDNILNQPEENSDEAPDSGLGFFHRVCEKTFDAARKSHYENEQPLSAFIEEDDNTEELSSGPSLEEADFPAFSAGQTSSSPFMGSQAQPRTANGRRCEVVWKPPKEGSATLSDISARFNLALASSSSSLNLGSVPRSRRHSKKLAHRCPGYKRLEIALTPRPSKSAVISYDTPLPTEICSVCGEVVGFDQKVVEFDREIVESDHEVVESDHKEIFSCACGEEDDGSRPIARCTDCFEWHHSDCVGVTSSSFVCPKCRFRVSSNANSQCQMAEDQQSQKHVSFAEDLDLQEMLWQQAESERYESQYESPDVYPAAESPSSNMADEAEDEQEAQLEDNSDPPARGSERLFSAALTPMDPSPASRDEMEVQLAPGQGMQFSNSSTTFTYFESAQNVRLEDVKFYNIRGNLINVHGRGEESREAIGIIKGARVVDREDVLLERQIYKGGYYRLHAGLNRGKVVMVKTYEGVEAKEVCLTTFWLRCVLLKLIFSCAEGKRSYTPNNSIQTHRMHIPALIQSPASHPNIPNLVAVSRLETPTPFLVFQGSYDGPLEHVLMKTLKKGLKESWIMGLKTVGISLRLLVILSYVLSRSLVFRYSLNDEEFNFASLPPDNFVLLSSAGNPIITFKPDGRMNHIPEARFHETSDSALGLFHLLCEKTFDAARKAHYETEQALSAFIEEDDNAGELTSAPIFEESDFATSSTGQISGLPSFRRSAQPKTGSARRWELVWKPAKKGNSTLCDISSQFNSALSSDSSSSLGLTRRSGRYISRTSHRCPGYNRVEIALTPDIEKSALISHASPVPSEICLVCKEVVKAGEIFNCKCGNKDDESVPTVKCGKCFEWHHRDCVAAAGLTIKDFICDDCLQIREPQGYSNLGPQSVPAGAVTYLNAVRDHLGNRPDVYEHFLDITKDFKDGKIATPSVVKRLAQLFNGHAALVQGFNVFLPPGYLIECSVDLDGSDLISLITPGDIRLSIASSALPQPRLQASPHYVHNDDATHASPPVLSLDSEMHEPNSHRIEPALQYIHDVKQHCDATMYRQFLHILSRYHDFSVDEEDTLRQIADLFKDAPDLSAGFRVFVPVHD